MTTSQLTAERAAELDLCQRVSKNDRAAADTLARTVLPTVRAVARRLTRTDPDAHDAMQVALVEILRAAGTFRADGPLRGWAGRIAMRVVARFVANVRARGRREDALGDEPADGGSFSTVVVDALPRSLAAYLDELPPEQRTALVLRHSLGCTVPEIAEMTQSPVPTVKSRLVKALERVRQAVRRDVRFGAKKVGA